MPFVITNYNVWTTLKHAQLQNRLKKRQWYTSLPKEKKDALLRKKEAYAKKELLKGISSSNVTSSLNTGQQIGM